MMIDPLRPTNPPARTAGLVWMILGGMALLLGLGLLLSGLSYESLLREAELREKLNELQKNTPFNLRTLLLFSGGMFISYGVSGLVLGPLVRAGFRLAIILGLVLAIAVTLVSGLNVIGAVVRGSMLDAVIPIGLTCLHVWIIRLQIEALRNAAAGTITQFAAPRPYQPMQAYFEPPAHPKGIDEPAST